jgi:hypothetical protein
MCSRQDKLDEMANAMPKEFWDNLIEAPIGWVPPQLTLEDFRTV